MLPPEVFFVTACLSLVLQAGNGKWKLKIVRWPWGHGALGQKGETEIKDYSILWPRIILRLISSGPDSVNGKSERYLLLWSAFLLNLSRYENFI